jgi:predicted nucleic acid-binding Zn ribbon protein
MSGFSANGTRKCEKCGAPAKRLISAPQVVFHGSGFYATDNKRPAKAASGSSKPSAKEKAAESTVKKESAKENKSGSAKRSEAS